MNTATKSYWSSTGRYQAAYAELLKLIPVSGECPDAKTKNKALDRLRRAANCYYDLFNNGLCNRAAEFRSIFGFSPKKEFPDRSVRYSGRYLDIDFDNVEMNERLNTALDGMIAAASIEQGLGHPELAVAKAFAADFIKFAEDPNPMIGEVHWSRLVDSARTILAS